MFDSNLKKSYSAIIGDSLIIILSLNKNKASFQLKFVSSEQSHGFNIPYQVGYDCDNAENAIISENCCSDKDIIIIASDGLWDNLSIKNILNLINQIKDKYSLIDCESVAQLLVKQAQVISYSKTAITPFSIKAKENGSNKIGGKLDDITVIVSQIDITNNYRQKSILSKTSSFNNNTTNITTEGDI